MMKVTGAAKPMSSALLVVLVLVMAKINPAAGQDQPCNTTFFSSLVQLMPCRPAVAPFSPSSPSEICCNAIRSLGQLCLCAIINGPPIAGIDRSMALQLPSKCSIEAQPCTTA